MLSIPTILIIGWPVYLITSIILLIILKKRKNKYWPMAILGIIGSLALLFFPVPELTETNGYHYELQLIAKPAFKDLQKSIVSYPNLQNIAILPKQEYIVVNGIVIDTKQHTYGIEPGFGVYQEYYENAHEHHYDNLNEALQQQQIDLNEETLAPILERMKELEFQDITVFQNKYDNIDILFRMDVSAMWGEKGIEYSTNELEEFSNDSATRKKIQDHYYYFYRE